MSLEQNNTDISNGKIADPDTAFRHYFPEDVLMKFEIFSYRNAAGVLASSFPDQFTTVLDVLSQFRITREQIRTPGESKGPIAQYVDSLFPADWVEARISADLHVKLLHAKGSGVFRQYVREGFLDGHRIDFVNEKVALDRKRDANPLLPFLT